MYGISYMTVLNDRPGRHGVSIEQVRGNRSILQISENRRSYRTWVTLLRRTQLEDETAGINGTR